MTILIFFVIIIIIFLTFKVLFFYVSVERNDTSRMCFEICSL